MDKENTLKYLGVATLTGSLFYISFRIYKKKSKKDDMNEIKNNVHHVLTNFNERLVDLEERIIDLENEERYHKLPTIPEKINRYRTRRRSESDIYKK